MPIAQMPGEAREGSRFCGDLDQAFGCCANRDPATILELQPVAVLERQGARQVQEKFLAAVRSEPHSSAVAIIESKRDGAGGANIRPMSRPLGACGTLPGQNRKYRCAIATSFSGPHVT